MFVREVLHIQQLIEEREIYENDFVDEIAISKSEEMDYQIDQYEFIQLRFVNRQFYLQDNYEEIDTGFVFEDYLDKLRDEQMIECWLDQNSQPDWIIEDYYADYDPLDAQIDSLNPNFNHYVDLRDDDVQYDYYIDDCDYFYDDYDDCYVEEINMDAAYCGSRMYGYVVTEDEFDSLGGCDYPEGPDENLNGFRFPEYECPYEEVFIVYPDEFFECTEPEYQIEAYYFDVSDIEKQEEYLKKLIDEHLAEEREFYNFVNKYEVPDDYYLPAGAEDLIFS